MSRYTGPKFRVSRRLGVSLSGTGKEIARRNYAPGDHGAGRREKISDYGMQLAEKQKVRFTYGLTERQFHNLFNKAGKIRKGTHGENFIVLLERRLFTVWAWLQRVNKHVNWLTTATSWLMVSVLTFLHTKLL